MSDGHYEKTYPYQRKHLHLVRYTGEDKCQRCCLADDERLCGKYERYCEGGYFMRTEGWHKTYRNIFKNQD